MFIWEGNQGSEPHVYMNQTRPQMEHTDRFSFKETVSKNSGGYQTSDETATVIKIPTSGNFIWHTAWYYRDIDLQVAKHWTGTTATTRIGGRALGD